MNIHIMLVKREARIYTSENSFPFKRVDAQLCVMRCLLKSRI